MSTLFRALSAATCLAAISATPLLAQSRVGVGTLQCDVSAGVGMIIGSTRQLDCVLDPLRGPDQRYIGTVRHAGLDLGVTGGGVMVWSVLSSNAQPRFPMTGRYVGAQASGSLGVGLGANALVGGNESSFALQPISVQAQTGVNIAVGVAELTLEPVVAERRRIAPVK
jgi:hypothetical protein